MTQPDFSVRQSRTQAIMAYFRQHPGEWIGVHRLAHVGGFAAWRSRVSEARTAFETEGLTIEWNHEQIDSAYRLRPIPLGRDATVQPSDLQRAIWREGRLPGL